MCFAAYTPNLFAQGSDLGTIRGTVTDSSGALIPNAQVKITNLGNLRVYTYKTSARGSFDAPDLAPGQYKAAVTAPGFETSVITGIVLNGSDVSQQNAVLHPATQTVNVQVTTEAVGINTDDSTLAQTLNPTAVIDLPRDSRDINTFLYIDPSITQGDASGGAPSYVPTFKAIGTQSYGASFVLDGQRNSGGMFGFQTSSEPSLEAIGELNVLSSTFSAEYSGVVNIRINTKSGGAKNHGSLFYNDLNSGLEARPLNHTTKPHSNDTQFGGSWGGPIPKLKNTFFESAYEYWDYVAPIFETNQTGILATDAQSGDYSTVAGFGCQYLPNLATIALDSPGGVAPSGLETEPCAATGTTVVTGVPSNVQNPYTSKLVSLYFPKNIASSSSGTECTENNRGRYTSCTNTYPGGDKVRLGDLRIDHDFSDSNRLYGVYHGSAENNITNFVSYPYTGLGLNEIIRLNSVVSLSYTHVFTANLVNEARGGYNFQNEGFEDPRTVSGFLSSIGFSSDQLANYGNVIGANALALHGNPNINFSSSGITGFGDDSRSSDRKFNSHLITFGDTVNWQKGRHAFKIGADFVHNEAEDGFGATRNTPQSSMSYNGGLGLTGYTNFLLGNAPHSYTYVDTPRPPLDVSNWETAYYAQDDFRVNSRLTLNLGMRYDRYTPYVDKNDIMANFDPFFRDAATGQVGEYVIPSAKTLQYLQFTESSLPPNGIGYVFASESGQGIGRGLVRPDRFDIGPRLGWAYRINDKQVLRGGVGVFYPSSLAHQVRDPLCTNTFNGQLSGTASAGYPAISPWPSVNQPNSVPVVGGNLGGFGFLPGANWVPFGIKNPRLIEWNATFERQLGWQTAVRASYIGGHQQGQIMGNDMDMINANDNPYGTTTGEPYNGMLWPTVGYTGPYYACDPLNVGDCNYSEADNSRINFRDLGDFVTGFGNHGHSWTNSLQLQAERKAKGLTFSFAYTYLSQKSSAEDANTGGTSYNPFQPNYDYDRDSFVSRHRVVAYAVYDLPFGHGQHYAATANRITDAIIGGWQLTTNMFAKTGIGVTPQWDCSDCDPVMPGNIASGDLEYLRPNLLDDPHSGRLPGYQFNSPYANGGTPDYSVFGFPDIGSTFWSNPLVPKRNSLTGPGAWGVNLGIHKSVRINDRITARIGADADNVFNHPMYSPTNPDTYGTLGSVNILTPASVNGTDGAVLPGTEGRPNGDAQPAILPFTDPNVLAAVTPNPSFGKNNVSYSQEGIAGNRQIRLVGRITF
jgi:hypothetical protein